MLLEVAATTGALATGGALSLAYRRSAHYGRLGRELERARPSLKGLGSLNDRPAPDFSSLFATVSSLLPPAVFEEVRDQVETLVQHERSFIPTHKKGGTVAYETIIARAPKIASLYQSAEMMGFVSRIVGSPVRPTPLHDQSSLSVLFYDRPGDHIGWHYDHNFYRGRHFTVLMPMVNRGTAEGGLSHARLEARLATGETCVPTPPNSLVVFEGARVHHRVTPIAEVERRVVLSMTYCTDPRSSVPQAVARRVKDIAFFGVRALWT